MILFMLACQSPAPDVALVTPPSDTAPTGSVPPTEPVVPSPQPNTALPAAIDFTAAVQGGGTLRLSDHAGDILLVDIAGFT